MTNKYDVETKAQSRELELPDRHDGPGAAAMVAAGTGIFVLGLLTLLSELSEAVHDFLGSLDFGRGVGPLAGKTILASLAFFIIWAIVGLVWRESDPDIKRVFWIGMALGIAGVIMTFPPVFTAFG
ncbi:MAG TPA: hypothetical protein VF148_15035 [Acidimicrobiia bacterium]